MKSGEISITRFGAVSALRIQEWLREESHDVRSLLVVKDGKLIFERYTNNLSRDYSYELYSITKSLPLPKPRRRIS